MTDSDSDDREQGIDFGDLEDELESHDYPVAKDDLVEEYGDRELDLPEGSTTFGEILDGYEPTDGDFESADDVRSAVMNMVGDDAVGPEDYSDRGTGTDENESGAV